MADENFTKDNWDTKFTRVTNAPVIGIIVTHGEALCSEDLPKYYRSLGYIVEKIFTKITPDLLNEYNLVIVGQWYETWLPSEIAAVEAYINSGGGFVAIGHALSDSVQEILGAYGISYTGIKAGAGRSIYFNPLHPIMHEVNSIFVNPWPRWRTTTYNSLNVSGPAYWIANDSSNTHIVIAGANVEGLVLCMSTTFAEYVYYCDNEIMFKNIVDWMMAKSRRGDVNSDGIVNIFDGVVIGTAWDSRPCGPNWDPRADLKPDGVINIYDIVIWGEHFGETV